MLLCSICVPALAATVHSWVDEDGVTHFSDAPPAGAVSDVRTLELQDNFPDSSHAQANYYSISNQWERMREERDRKTQIDLEKERIRVDKAAVAASQAPPAAADTAGPRYFPTYFPITGYGLPARRAHDYRGTDGPVERRPHHVRSGDGHIRGGARRQPQSRDRGAGGGRAPRREERFSLP